MVQLCRISVLEQKQKLSIPFLCELMQVCLNMIVPGISWK